MPYEYKIKFLLRLNAMSCIYISTWACYRNFIIIISCHSNKRNFSSLLQASSCPDTQFWQVRVDGAIREREWENELGGLIVLRDTIWDKSNMPWQRHFEWLHLACAMCEILDVLTGKTNWSMSCKSTWKNRSLLWNTLILYLFKGKQTQPEWILYDTYVQWSVISRYRYSSYLVTRKKNNVITEHWDMLCLNDSLIRKLFYSTENY